VKSNDITYDLKVAAIGAYLGGRGRIPDNMPKVRSEKANFYGIYGTY